ncbi:NETI motif-containing protein [Marinococcus luteus]|uniref:NETI motif-containing protein n=1 Tax=Marinococcus luteus TaxID=1122204 RepID=UPI002ACC52E3|nr:NETI motif-containing protein [Marinococcus luteus]MDZ5783308.1 NETI motif-containing protein [Marinococcus luteus]
MAKKKNKQTFYVHEEETVEDCLARMAAEGFMPVRRMEKPIFEEQTINGEMQYVPVRQEISFEAKKK